MKIDIMTLFPETIKNSLGESIIGRAAEGGLLQIEYHQIRDFSENKQKKVDDTPYGGGPGMLMTYQPLKSCFDHICACREERPYTVYMSPRGSVFNSETAKRLAALPGLCIVCGHYEGVDQRFIDEVCDEEISIGDFVLTGGELPAALIVDSISRFVPGVLGSEESSGDESFEGLLLEYPQYTKPCEINGKKVPEVLLGGNHADIISWRRQQSEAITKERRPDLYERYLASEYNPSRNIYLDNSATTFQTENVTRIMAETARKYYGNPSSLHSLGFEAEKRLTAARKVLADTVGASPDEIIITSGGSESNNLAIKGFFLANKRAGRHIIISAVEHPSVTETARSLEAFGIRVSLLPVDNRGVVRLDELESLITEETSLISVMTVNSEVGSIMPIKEIARVKNKINPKILLHTDFVQGYGKLKTCVSDLSCDMLSVSAHKIHGPRGIGFLYVRKGIRLSPIINGGGQEAGLRSGTENLPAVAGFAEAAENAFAEITASYGHVYRVRKILCDKLKERYGEKIVFNTDLDASLPYILNISFSPLRAEVVLHALEARNVFVSVGSACSSHKKNRSPVLTAMGVPVNIIDGSVRLSFSRFTTEADIDRAFEAIEAVVKELKRAVYRK